MKTICVLESGRADRGMLKWPVTVLREEFNVFTYPLDGLSFPTAFNLADGEIQDCGPDLVLILGDRYEALAAAIAAHLQRVKIAHLCGGDVTEGSYDDAMRDCISRLAWIHFPSSLQSAQRLAKLGYHNIHMVGSTGIDFIKNADWKKERPYPHPYVVVSYQPETLDDTNDLPQVLSDLPDCFKYFILPNPDRGSAAVAAMIEDYAKERNDAAIVSVMPHDQFLNLLFHCEEFIGNSSAIFYEAPVLGIKTRLIGKRQKGRVIPFGDGRASERIRDILLERL